MEASEEAIASLVRGVYIAMTEEVPRERSRVSGGDSSNVEEELSRMWCTARGEPPL